MAIESPEGPKILETMQTLEPSKIVGDDVFLTVTGLDGQKLRRAR